MFGMRGSAIPSVALAVIEPVDVLELQAVINYEKPKSRSQVNLVPSDQVKKLVDLLHSEAKVI